MALCLLPLTRRFLLSPLGTLIHEYGHVVANLFTFGKPTGIKIYWGDNGGVTHSLRSGGLFNGVGMFVSGIAGYPAPILLGLTLIASVTGGYASTVALVMLIITGVFFLLMRSLTGIALSLISGLFYFYTWNHHGTNPLMLYCAGFAYLAMGLCEYWSLTYHYFRGNPDVVETDLGILRSSTYVPMWLSWFVMTTGTLIAAFFILSTMRF